MARLGYWRELQPGSSDPATLAGFNPGHQPDPITSGNQIGLIQSTDSQPLPGAQFLGKSPTVQHQLQAQGVNHYTIRRVVDVQCNVEGRDLGSVSTAVGRYVSQLKGVPRGTQIRILGEAQAMRESFTSLGEGLIFAMLWFTC